MTDWDCFESAVMIVHQGLIDEPKTEYEGWMGIKPYPNINKIKLHKQKTYPYKQ